MLVWVPSNCYLCHFSRPEASKCLRARHIERFLLAGDSVVNELFFGLKRILSPVDARRRANVRRS